MTVDHTLGVELSAERPAVRQRERELALGGGDRQDPAGHVGGPGAAAPQQQERAGSVGTESLLRLPQPRQFIRGAGGGEHQGQDERAGDCTCQHQAAQRPRGKTASGRAGIGAVTTE